MRTGGSRAGIAQAVDDVAGGSHLADEIEGGGGGGVVVVAAVVVVVLLLSFILLLFPVVVVGGSRAAAKRRVYRCSRRDSWCRGCRRSDGALWLKLFIFFKFI